MIRRLFALLALVLWAGTASAQDGLAVDFDAFDDLSQEIAQALEADTVPVDRLEAYRAEIADWRSRLSGAQDINASEIAALESQLAALGPAPAEGESEPGDVAAERETLEERLSQARAPQIQAEQAFARADVLIGQIDAELRQRQADALLELGPTPLNPALWPTAATDVVTALDGVRQEIGRNLRGAGDLRQLRQRAPLILGAFLIAVLLIVRGPRWIETAEARLATRTGPVAAAAWGFPVSLGEILLPVLGLTFLINAVRLSGLLGETGNSLALALNAMIFVLAVGRWLARRIFPADQSAAAPFALTESQSTEGRFLTRALATLVAWGLLVAALGEIEGVAETTEAVLTFPILVLSAVFLFRLGHLFRKAVKNVDTAEDESVGFMLRLAGYLGGALRLIAVAGVLAAAVGYDTLGSWLIGPTIITLALIGVVIAVHVFVRAAWGLSRGLDREALDEALLPIVVTFALSLASLPILALIWGARATDLGEIWTQFLGGVRIGESRLRPGDFLAFLLVFAIGFAVTRLIQGALRSSVLPRTRLDKGGQSAVVSGLGYIGLTIAALIAITAAGIDLSSLAIVVGALGVGIGFGLQNIVNNFVSGIIMLIERPVSEGDIVDVGGRLGTVKAISVRSTRIETFDRQDVIVPNGDFISGTVTNWTKGNAATRVTVTVGVAYASDSRRVQELLEEICSAHPLVAADPPPKVFFLNFGADALEFTCYCILRDMSFMLQVHSELNHEIHARFREEGIEIPFAQRDLWLRNPESLRSEAARSEAQSDARRTARAERSDPPIAHGGEIDD